MAKKKSTVDTKEMVKSKSTIVKKMKKESTVVKRNEMVMRKSTVEKTKKSKEMMKKRNESKQRRNWADLPTDVLSTIFEKLGAFEIVWRAQFVCSAWQTVSKQPDFFPSIRLYPPWYFRGTDSDIVRIGKQIIDRSGGQLASLSMVIHVSDEVLHYALDKPNALKSLKLSGVLPDGLVNILRKVPFLEKLHLSVRDPHFYYNTQILAIAEHMSQLRELRLGELLVSNEDLEALIHGCPHLECLDLRNCAPRCTLSKEILDERRKRFKIFKLSMRRLDY